MWRAIAASVLTLASLPLWSQGVPPSVTSMGPGGTSGALPPSVTSMSPFGSHGPRGKLFPVTPHVFPRHPAFNGRFHPGQRHHGTGAVLVPWYAPYPVYVYPDNSWTDATGPERSEWEGAAVPPNTPPAAIPYAPPVAPPTATAPDAPPASVPAAAVPALALPSQETTILVFRDGHQMEVTDYAIVGEELINLSGKGPRRIPLAELDLPATVRVNDDRGVAFRLPNG